MSFLDLIIPALVAFGITFMLTPLAIGFAKRVGAIDVPKDARKIHKKPIPYGGGLAIFFSFFITLLFFGNMESGKLIGLFISSLMMLIVGFVDDIKPISAKLKLLLQIVAALILFYSGHSISYFSDFFGSKGIVSLGVWAPFITILWVVGVTNTVNLIDGLDGLAAGLSGIASITITILALINTRPEIAILSVILAGSCFGLLPMNFNPAKVFMGDAGAYFIGIALSVFSMEGALKGATAITVLVPILAIGIPIFDTSYAIIRRKIKGQPIMAPDRGHLHHKFIDTGMGQKRAVLSLYIVNALLGIGAVALLNGDTVYSFIFFVVAILFILFALNLSDNSTSSEELRKSKAKSKEE